MAFPLARILRGPADRSRSGERSTRPFRDTEPDYRAPGPQHPRDRARERQRGRARAGAATASQRPSDERAGDRRRVEEGAAAAATEAAGLAANRAPGALRA